MLGRPLKKKEPFTGINAPPAVGCLWHSPPPADAPCRVLRGGPIAGELLRVTDLSRLSEAFA